MKIAYGVMAHSVIGIRKAEKMFGSEKALAEKIGVDRQRLSYWKTVTLIPYEFAVEIFMVTGGKVTLDELRVDRKKTNDAIRAIYFEEFMEKLRVNKNLFLQT